jgi:hypothetical protein
MPQIQKQSIAKKCNMLAPIVRFNESALISTKKICLRKKLFSLLQASFPLKS